MNQPILAEHVVDVLTRLVTRTVDGPHRRNADTLYDAVIGRLRRTRNAEAFDLFEADPHSAYRRQTLVDLLNHQFANDPVFRDTVAALVKPAAGHREPNRNRPSPRKLALWAGGAVLLVGLAIGARALYVNLSAEPELDGTTQCRTFFALTEPEQRTLLVRAYHDRGQERRQDEPYIVASVLYACGQNPESTVNQIIENAA
ncbi:hypothetical protein [Actinokineospora sp. NBRC 105648]|uniref:hypothetical protein n=1 Tax=Actinokineospora sp. NBRC 105648 TaxID=3032206 RepID=UPI0024A27EC9|nr:hypothetical protein [Actinokineospora sp. NBRC 105648]GLZ43696.1 hypothetical protein Acsp05_73200 [Actinokineospora sp. NBRC 105648]